ncbi:MAG: glycoside hydrolase [Treponema sp.]|nr:glycoside hydrolase [Treponema sp.]
MKRTVLLLITSLLLLSSCKFAQSLNNSLGLKAPEDRNYLTVFADLDSKDYKLVDLGDEFRWGETKITLGQLLKDVNFSDWYSGLKNEEWNKVGIYAPETDRGLLTENIEFTISKNEAFYVGWDSPFEKIRIRANNFTKQYFEYYLPYRYAYDKEIELKYVDVRSDDYFNEWLNGLDSSVNVGSGYYAPYSPVGFTEQIATSSNYNSLENKKSVSINKWKVYVNIGWVPNTLITGFSVYANDGSEMESSRYFALDGEYESFDVSWNYLVSSDDGFLAWYQGLSKPGLGKNGISSQKDTDWGVLHPNSPNNTIILRGENINLYVNWGQEVSYIDINANNGTSDSFRFYPSVSDPRLKLTWNMLERNDQFMVWYKGLSDHSRGIYTLGLSTQSGSSQDVSLDICQYDSDYSCSISTSNNTLYVVYGSYVETNYAFFDFLSVPSFIAGESYQARYSVSRESAPSVKSIEFSSDKPSVASIDNHGLLSARSEGDAVITFKVNTYSGNSYTNICSVAINRNSVFKKITEFESYAGTYAVSADGTKQVLAEGSQFVFSSDSGKTWRSKRINDLGYCYRLCMSPSGETIMAIVQNYGDSESFDIVLIKDEGNTYSTVYSVSGMYSYSGKMSVSNDGNTIAFSHYDSNSNGNVYISNNGGKDWRVHLISGKNGVAVSASGKNVVYSSSDKVFYSRDYGNTFSELNFWLSNAIVEELKISSDERTILALVNQAGNKEIYKIVDGSLSNVITPAGSDYIYNMYVSPDCNGIIYRGNNSWLYYSTDAGMSWNRISERMVTSPELFITNNMKETYFYHSFKGTTSIYRWNRY